ncbi:MAG: DsbA family protein [Rhodospirillaceae bacterium]|nr:DsbA family protein [Rhodospirillaceae bacterium]
MTALRLMTVVLAILFSSVGITIAADTPAPSEVEKAIQAYAAKLEADAFAAAGKTAKARAADILRHPGTPVLGNANGDITIVTFFDYQCPFCKANEPRILQLLKDDPKVRFVTKDFPILGPASIVAAKAALASVRQGKHEALHNAMMAYRGKLDDGIIFTLAESAGLDVARLKADMTAPEIADQLLANMNLARALKISVVPGYIVEDKVLSGLSNKTETAKINFADEVAQARARKAQAP